MPELRCRLLSKVMKRSFNFCLGESAIHQMRSSLNLAVWSVYCTHKHYYDILRILVCQPRHTIETCIRYQAICLYTLTGLLTLCRYNANPASRDMLGNTTAHTAAFALQMACFTTIMLVSLSFKSFTAMHATIETAYVAAVASSLRATAHQRLSESWDGKVNLRLKCTWQRRLITLQTWSFQTSVVSRLGQQCREWCNSIQGESIVFVDRIILVELVLVIACQDCV